jgi:hypothetical protein
MLAKQWQMGEFHGEDAGSPVLARVTVQHQSARRPTLRRRLP